MNRTALSATLALVLVTIGAAKAQDVQPGSIVSEGIANPFPKCGEGEVGVTRDGKLCWNGPIPGNPNYVPLSPEEEQEA